MDNWILDNLEKLVPVVIAILYFLSSSKAKKVENQRKAADPESDERSRRIQEEIRRKILERQQQGKPVARSGPSEPPFSSEPVFERPYDPVQAEPIQERSEVDWQQEREAITVESELSEAEDLFEKQRRQIEEQMQKARELRKQLPSMHGERSPRASGKAGVRSVGDFGVDIRRDLKDVGSVRRAIVLKEILDTPLALR